MNFQDIWIVGPIFLLVAAPFVVALMRNRGRDKPAEGEQIAPRGFFYVEPGLIAAVVIFFVGFGGLHYLMDTLGGKAFAEKYGEPMFGGMVAVAMIVAPMLTKVVGRLRNKP